MNIGMLRRLIARDIKTEVAQTRLCLGDRPLGDKERLQDLIKLYNDGNKSIELVTKLTEGKMIITLQRNGKRMDIWIEANATVQVLKDTVCDKCNLTHNSFNLFVRGRPVVEGRKLVENLPPVSHGTVVVVIDQGQKARNRSFKGHLLRRGPTEFMIQGAWKALEVGDYVVYKKRHLYGQILDLDDRHNPVVRLEDGIVKQYAREEVKKVEEVGVEDAAQAVRESMLLTRPLIGFRRQKTGAPPTIEPLGVHEDFAADDEDYETF